MRRRLNDQFREFRIKLMQAGWTFAYRIDPYTMKHEESGHRLVMTAEIKLMFVLLPPEEEQTRFNQATWYHEWETILIALKLRGLWVEEKKEETTLLQEGENAERD